MAAVLEGGAQMAEGLLAPLNREGDRCGARFENGRVFAAPGFADAYREYAAGGWTSLAAAPEHGGQGLPKAVSLAVFEMAHAANMAFAPLPHVVRGRHRSAHRAWDARDSRRSTCPSSSAASGRAR